MSIGVLFVCTGNICRSPSAEAVFRAMAVREGLGAAFRVDSAGTESGHFGEPPSRLAVATAARRGYDLAGLRARDVAADDVARFDHVLAMDRGHLRALRRLAPSAPEGRVRLFLAHAPELALTEVPDPWHGGPADYERALDLIEAGCAGLLRDLRAASLTA